MENRSRQKRFFQRALTQYEIKKSQEIQRLQEQIECTTNQLKGCKDALTAEKSELERKRLNHKIILLDQRRQGLRRRLAELGVEEKRGRPKKRAADTYKAQRVKFTAHLLPENMDYLRELKVTNQIDNISAFLDDLIKHYQKKNGNSKNGSKSNPL